ncbi:MAG: ribosome maturation factor RimP [Candidatus Binataceae bacterium]
MGEASQSMGQLVTVLELDPVAQRVMELLTPHIEREGFELVSAEYRRGTGNGMLRLFADRPDGGITLDELEVISRTVGDLLDVYDPVEGRYTLEVSSPGINRPLVKLNHFEAFRGRRIRLRTHAAREGQKVFVGILATVNPGGIELDDEISRRHQAFAFNELKEAHYEHEFK